MIKEKLCKGCKVVLSVEFFTRSKNVKDGYENKCKKCRLEQRRKYKVKCESCGKEFRCSNKNTRFCGQQCVGQSRVKRVKVDCSYCGEKKNVILSLAERLDAHYCNQKCRTEHLKLTMIGEGNPNYNRIEKPCDGCGKNIKVVPFEIENLNNNFCSYTCYTENIGRFYSGENNHNYNRKKYNCEYCGCGFERIPSANRGERVFCSRECYLETQKERERKTEIELECPVCDKKILVWRSRLNHTKRVYCSRECANIGNSRFYSGENSPNWNPLLSKKEREEARKYEEYYEWRREVFSRDNYTCKCCGDTKGGNLVAHHILNYSEHADLRTIASNGITLCEGCHKEFHDTYGYTKNNLNQLNEYISNYYKASTS